MAARNLLSGHGTLPEQLGLETNTSPRSAHLDPIWTPALSILPMDERSREEGG